MPLASSQAQGKDFDGHVNYQEIRSEKTKKSGNLFQPRKFVMNDYLPYRMTNTLRWYLFIEIMRNRFISIYVVRGNI